MAAIMSAAVSGRKYRGRTAENYTKNREGQKRWQSENAALEAWLPERVSVLDVPCGDGRFFELYARRRCAVTALDVSEPMLAIARARAERVAGWRPREVAAADALRLPQPDRAYDVVVCARLLHLVSQREAGQVLRQICRLARRTVILTIRLAERAIANPSSTTHPERWFRSRVRAAGWQIAEERVLSRQGWRIMRLERRD